MPISGNAIDNNVLVALGQRAGAQVTGAIKAASARTGVDFAYLMEQAAAESSFDTDAKAKTSSASGLYQFIESTWLRMVKQHGHKYGMGKEAEQISDNGKVESDMLRNEILELRNDPRKAAFLAAEFASDNKRYLEQNTNVDIGPTELYLAHFLGASGAAGFLNAMEKNPLTAAADIFPKAANANRNVFYDRETGEPRSLSEVHAFFAKKFKGSEQLHSEPKQITTLKHAPLRISVKDWPFEIERPQDRVIGNFMAGVGHDFWGVMQAKSHYESLLSYMATPSSLRSDAIMLLAELEMPVK